MPKAQLRRVIFYHFNYGTFGGRYKPDFENASNAGLGTHLARVSCPYNLADECWFIGMYGEAKACEAGATAWRMS